MNIQQLSVLITENNVEVDKTNVSILAHTETVANRISSVAGDVNRIMRRFGFDNFTLIPKLALIGNEMIEKEKKELEEQAARAFENAPAPVQEKQTEYKKTQYVDIEIDELLTANEPRVSVRGEIFAVNHKPTKTEMTITELGITNFRDAITVKLFAKKPEDIAANQSYKPGQYVHVSGDYQLDSYSKEPVILARKAIVTKNEKTSREDKAKEKRIEFGARTRMSTMDGIVSPTELVKRAAK